MASESHELRAARVYDDYDLDEFKLCDEFREVEKRTLEKVLQGFEALLLTAHAPEKKLEIVRQGLELRIKELTRDK